MNGKNLKSYLDLGLLLLRLYLGISMIHMSSGYLFDDAQIGGLISFLESLNWPLPRLFAYSSQLVELISGILILLGFRIGGVFLFLVLITAVTFAHGFRIFGEAMLPMNFAVMALLIALIGCGRFSLDSVLFGSKN